MTKPANSIRNRELAQIHIAKQQLGLDDDTYREMLWTIGRVRSSKDLDHAGRRRVLEHLHSRGWKNDVRKGKPRTVQSDELLGKIEAQLADMTLPWAYAHSMAKRMFRRDRLEWCKPKELHDIVAALAYEQQKRDCLATVDVLLGQLGQTRADVDALLRQKRPQYRKNWTRDLRMLKALVRYLDIAIQRKAAS